MARVAPPGGARAMEAGDINGHEAPNMTQVSKGPAVATPTGYSGAHPPGYRVSNHEAEARPPPNRSSDPGMSTHRMYGGTGEYGGTGGYANAI
jgi:hypothetical protein